MTRVQVLLTEEQDRKLEALARARRRSKARLVREGPMTSTSPRPACGESGDDGKERIHYAFAFDAHFSTAGFVRIPDG